MKTAVIGCGYWGPNLVRHFDLLSDGDTLVCCDKDRVKLDRMSCSHASSRCCLNAGALIATHAFKAADARSTPA